jgi:hypothetical protein
MSDLSIDAFRVAVRQHTDYLPLSTFPDDLLPKARLAEAASSGIPHEHLIIVNPNDVPEVAVSGLALAALGAPPREQPLFLVRSGPLRDPMVTILARLVLEADWAGEDVGITHLDELGGTVAFGLLDWAVPDDTGATVLICDEPWFADGRVGSGRFATVGMRVRRGPGPLRVLDCGEGAPGRRPNAAERRFTGSGPCDGWLDLHAALVAGEIADGDELLLHTKGPLREGWLSVRAVDVAGLMLTDAELVGSAVG